MNGISSFAMHGIKIGKLIILWERFLDNVQTNVIGRVCRMCIKFCLKIVGSVAES